MGKARGKGKGKGQGKSKSNECSQAKGKSKGDNIFQIKESRVELNSGGQDDALDFVFQLMKERGEAVPEKHAVGDYQDIASLESDQSCDESDARLQEEGAEEEEEREDYEEEVEAEDGSDERVSHPHGVDGASRLMACTENRARKKLLQQLIREDRCDNIEEDHAINWENIVSFPACGGDASQTVRVFVTDATQMHMKPRSFFAPRGDAEAVEWLLRKARSKLGFKGKKSLTAYTVSPDGTPFAKLLSTSGLAKDQLLAISTRELTLGKAKEVPVGCARAKPEQVAEADKALGNVKLAYAQRAEQSEFASQAFGCLSEVETQEMNASLLQTSLNYTQADQYKVMREARSALPAAQSRADLAAALAVSQVVIVVGETGSGKTTQCPNFILEAASEAGHGGEVSIVCTQPRRIAAISVAERVAQERGEEPGHNVGYAVRLEAKASRQTRLLFCTTGVLLSRLNSSPDLEGVTHVVVDEAHERNLHTDFLLALLRELLERRAQLRVVVMSATLEQGLFARYFQGFAFDPSDDLPVVHIAGRTFPCTINYMSDVYRATGKSVTPHMPDDDQKPSDDIDAASDAELEAWVRRVHRDASSDEDKVLVSPAVKRKADFDLIADLCGAILQGHLGRDGHGGVDDGSVLIFLPGYVEIERCLKALQSHPKVGSRAWLLPLHGSMPLSEQHRVFQRPPPGQRKIIAATNIAETSVTIDDITHVIDSGHVRETRYNPRSHMSVFSTVWVSASSAKQRAGRASRTRPGTCWRLYEQSFLENKLPAHTLCEMRRTALEELVLQLRLLELGDDAGAFLQRAPEPPAPEAVVAAVQALVSIGAMVNTAGLPLTALGFHLAHMPVDARVGKMLIYGALCRCLAPILSIAACLAHRSPFTRNFNRLKEEQQRRARAARFGHLRSDHLAVAAVYEEYQATRAKHGVAGVHKLCDEFGLSSSVLSGMVQLRSRFLRHLVETGFADTCNGDGGEILNSQKDKLALIRCAMCAGLFPNVVQVQRQGHGRHAKTVLVSRQDEKCAVHLSSLNSHQLSEFPANSAWLLYHVKIQTNQIFLQDSTLVGSLPLLLFGGELRLCRDREGIILISGLRFKTKTEATAVILKMLRNEIDRLLLMKVANPNADLSRVLTPFLATVNALLQSDNTSASGTWQAPDFV